MVQAAHRDTAQRPLLRSVQEFGLLLRWGLVVLHIPQYLHVVSIGIGELVGPAMSLITVAPPLAQSGGLDSFGSPLQRLGRGGAPGYMSHSSLCRLSYFQGMVIEVFIRTQINRLSFPARLLHPKQLFEEPQRVIWFGGEQLHVSKLRYLE